MYRVMEPAFIEGRYVHHVRVKAPLKTLTAAERELRRAVCRCHSKKDIPPYVIDDHNMVVATPANIEPHFA